MIQRENNALTLWLVGQQAEESQPLALLSHMKSHASSSVVEAETARKMKQFIKDQAVATALCNANPNKLKLEMTFLIVLKHSVNVLLEVI